MDDINSVNHYEKVQKLFSLNRVQWYKSPKRVTVSPAKGISRLTLNISQSCNEFDIS